MEQKSKFSFPWTPPNAVGGVVIERMLQKQNEVRELAQKLGATIVTEISVDGLTVHVRIYAPDGNIWKQSRSFMLYDFFDIHGENSIQAFNRLLNLMNDGYEYRQREFPDTIYREIDGKKVEIKNIIYSTTTTQFNPWEGFKLMIGKKVTTSVEIFMLDTFGNVCDGKTVVRISPLFGFTKRKLGTGFSEMVSPNEINTPLKPKKVVPHPIQVLPWWAIIFLGITGGILGVIILFFIFYLIMIFS